MMLQQALRSRCAAAAATTSFPKICAFSSSPAASRRARRARRAQAKAPSKDSPGLLSEIKQTMEMVSTISSVSRNGLAQRVEMPQELLTRLTSVVKRRTHSQLQQLKQLHVGDATNARKLPLDSHKKPLGWTLDKSEQIPAFVYGPQETLAYLSFDMEATYACTHRVLSELQARLPSFKPQSLLDFGAGPGTASWAAKDVFGDALTKYRVVEPSQSMVDAAEVLLEGFPGLSVRRSVAELTRDIGSGTKYDVVVASYVLSEITSDFERVAVTSALWELLADDGVLVLVDRGSPWGSHHIRSARQFVLDSVAQDEGEVHGEASEAVRVLAPCPHQHECPAVGSGTWCHFVQRAPIVNRPREATTKRWHGQKGAKFSYVVMQKTIKTEKGEEEEEEEKPAMARLVRSPLLATRHVHLDMCTPDGALERRSVTKGKTIREVYRASRKAHWGALWPAEEALYLDKKEKK